MIISALIIIDHTFLDAFGRHIDCDMDQSVIAPVCCQDAQFDRIQRTPRIPARYISQEFNTRSSELPIPFSVSLTALLSSVLISSFSSGLSSKITDLEISALFTSKYGFSVVAPIRTTVRPLQTKKVVLLSFVEPMDLINEKDRLLSIHSLQISGFFYNLFHILLTG